MEPMKARYGEQSKNPVLKIWTRGSASNPDKPPYEIQLHNDGILTCNCRGWVNRASRDCRHVIVLKDEAQRFLCRPEIKPEPEPKSKSGRYIQLGGDWT